MTRGQEKEACGGGGLFKFSCFTSAARIADKGQVAIATLE